MVSGEASVPSRFLPSRVVVVGVDNLGRAVESQGAASRGYAGASFRALVPIGKVFLREVTICLQ